MHVPLQCEYNPEHCLFVSFWCYSFNQSQLFLYSSLWLRLYNWQCYLYCKQDVFFVCFFFKSVFNMPTFCPLRGGEFVIVFFSLLNKSQHLSKLYIPHDQGHCYHREGLIMIWWQVSFSASGLLDPPMKRKLLFWPLRFETGIV